MIISPDARYIAYGVYGRLNNTIPSRYQAYIVLWNIIADTREIILSGGDRNVTSLAFNSDGSLLASGGWQDGGIRLWDIQNQTEMPSIQTDNLVKMLEFISSDRLISVTDSGDVQVWNVRTTTQITKFRGFDIAFNPKRHILAVGNEDSRGVELFDTETLKELRILPIIGKPMAFSPNGDLILSGYETDIYLWDVRTGKQLKIFDQHATIVNDVEFSPNEDLIATAGTDGTIRVWGCKI
jgi:WD40 repeat protein